MRNFLLKHWPLLFIFAVWFIFAHPYFLLGKVPYASTYQVNFFPPWSHYQQFWGPVKNNAMPDVHTQLYPWKKFTIDTLKSGQIPLWNPYSFSGNPHLANFQSAVLTPFNLLFFIIPFIDAWSLVVLLQPLLAGVFMFLLMRTFKVSQAGSLISSIAFMFCGFIVVWMAYGTLAYSILYLPLALFAIEKYYEQKQLRFLILLALTIPLSFFSGHFQISLYFLTVLFFYILFKVVVTKNILNTSYLILATFLGLVFSSPQLLPSIGLYREAVRSELFFLSEAILLQYLIAIIAPDFFGNPVTRNDWFGHYAEWAGFIGVWPFVLATYAVIKFKSQNSKVRTTTQNLKSVTVIFFTILGAVSLVLAINSPLSSYIVSLKIPVLSTSALSRIIVLASFSLAVLGGFGLDQLIKDIRGIREEKRLIIILFLLGAFFIAIWLLLFFGKVYSEEWLIVAKRNFVLPTALFVGGIITILVSVKNKKLLLVASCYLLVAASFDSLRFAQKWMPFDPRHLVYPNVAVIDGIARHIGEGRIFGNIGAEVTTYYHFPSIEGYDPLYIARYGEFIRGATSAELLQAERSVVRLDRRGKYTDRVLDLLGVTLIFHPIADTNQGWAYPVWDKKDRYELVYEDNLFQLFGNKSSLSRALLFYDYEVIENPKHIIERFYSEDFDFRKKVILEQEPAITPSKGEGNVKITAQLPNKIKIHASSTSNALLFLSDNFYPRWKATVNGSSTKIYRANYSFRAIAIPRGESEVEFSYEDWHF